MSVNLTTAPGQAADGDFIGGLMAGIFAGALAGALAGLGLLALAGWWINATDSAGSLLLGWVMQITPDFVNSAAGVSDAETLRAAYGRFWQLQAAGWISTAVALAVGLLVGLKVGRPVVPVDGLHIEGPEYHKEPAIAAKKAQAVEGPMVKKTGEGLRLGGMKKGGRWVGGVALSRDRETKHLYVIGRTGGGKTVALKPVIMQAIERGDQVIVFDNKGEFSEWISDQAGNDPVIIAPWDARSHAWDIGRDCQTSAQAVELAERMIPDGQGDPMWNQGARQILAGLIKKLQSEMGTEWSWGDLARVLAVPVDQVEGIMREYHPEGLRAVEQVSDGAKEGGKSTSKTTQSLMITLSAQMSPVYRMAEAWEGAEKRFSIRDFIDKKSAQVVIMQGSDDYSSIATAYLQGMISMIRARINSPDFHERKPSDPGIWLILDEFPQMGKLPGIQKFLEIGRSKGIRVVFGLQDNSQMFAVYGKEDGQVLMAQPQSFILAGLGDPDSIKYMQSKIGQRVVERHRRNVSQSLGQGGSYTLSASMQRDKEPTIQEHQFNDGLGVHPGGVHSIWYPGQGDAYRLNFPFPATKKVRAPVVPARWTLSPEEQAQAKQEPEEPAEKERKPGDQAPKPKAQDTKPAVLVPVKVRRSLHVIIDGRRVRVGELAEGAGAEAGEEVALQIIGSLSEPMHMLVEALEVVEAIGKSRRVAGDRQIVTIEHESEAA